MGARKTKAGRGSKASPSGGADDSESPWIAGPSKWAAKLFSSTPWYLFALRAWLIAMFARTLWVTERLWATHVDPPMLPLADLPRFDDYGEILFITYALCFFWPRAALGVNIVVGLTAMIADQTRMQPQMFSFWLLMLGTWTQPTAQLLGRSYLASLWFFSGLHKLLSPEYFRDVAPWMLEAIVPRNDWPAGAGLDQVFGWTVAAIELVLGLAVLVRRLRPVAAVGGALVHAGILFVLWRQEWNTSVWAWNLAIMAAAAGLIGPWKASLAEERRRCGTQGFVLALLLFASPAMYYVGLLDAYLSHCLYSANVPTATMFPASRAPYGFNVNSDQREYWRNLNVPQPPTHRNFELYFRAVALPGDYVVIKDERWCARRGGYSHYAWRYDGKSYDRVELPTLTP